MIIREKVRDVGGGRCGQIQGLFWIPRGPFGHHMRLLAELSGTSAHPSANQPVLSHAAQHTEGGPPGRAGPHV